MTIFDIIDEKIRAGWKARRPPSPTYGTISRGEVLELVLTVTEAIELARDLPPGERHAALCKFFEELGE